MFKVIGGIVSGVASVLISDGMFFESFENFGIWLILFFICFSLGVIVDEMMK